MIRITSAALLLIAAQPLAAQQAAPAGAASTSPPDLALAPVDPARLAQGRGIASALVPPGTYRTMMKTMSDQMMGQIMNSMLDMPIRSLAGVGGATEEELAQIGPATSRQIMDVMDPAFETRMDRMMRVMFAEMGELFDSVEPDLREGLAEAYGARFTPDELADVNAFLKTPSGAKFGAQMMPTFMDPAMMQRMQAFMPKFMEAMPAIMKKVEAATADLPKPKKPADLSKADLARLEALVGKTRK